MSDYIPNTPIYRYICYICAPMFGPYSHFNDLWINITYNIHTYRAKIEMFYVRLVAVIHTHRQSA